MKTRPKILLLDIETAPASVLSWQLYDVNIGVNQIVRDGYMLMWAAKWLDEKKVMYDTVNEWVTDKRYDGEGEEEIANSIWKLLDEADIVVTHNGDDFDLRWLNAVFIKHKLPPPSSFKSIDTKKAAKSAGRFLSNSLAFLLKKLELGTKIDTGGFDLWTDCMAGDGAAWKRMITYCKNDVTSLEKLYKRLRPYIKNHPNMNLYSNCLICTNCGGGNLIKYGFAYTGSNVYQRYKCASCGKNVRDKKSLVSTKIVSA